MDVRCAAPMRAGRPCICNAMHRRSGFDEDALGKIGVSIDGDGATNLSEQPRLDWSLGEGAKRLLQSLIEPAHVAEGRTAQ